MSGRTAPCSISLPTASPWARMTSGFFITNAPQPAPTTEMLLSRRRLTLTSRIDHHVHTAAGQLLRLILPVAARAHDLVGAGVAGDLLLLVARDDGDRPGA